MVATPFPVLQIKARRRQANKVPRLPAMVKLWFPDPSIHVQNMRAIQRQSDAHAGSQRPTERSAHAVTSASRRREQAAHLGAARTRDRESMIRCAESSSWL